MSKKQMPVASLPDQHCGTYVVPTEPWSTVGKQRVSIADLARELGVTHATMRRWVQVGLYGLRLPVYYVGGRCFTFKENFIAWNEQVTAARLGASALR